MLVFFYIFAALTVLGALGVVLLPNPVYGALSLVGSFMAVAAIYILLSNEFVAAMQVLIYAGAIMVLFLFVIMLLNLRSQAPLRLGWKAPQLLGVAIAAVILVQMVIAFNNPAATLGDPGNYPLARIEAEGPVAVFGNVLFTDYVLPFEVVGVLLMIAVMGAVSVAKRRDEPTPPEEGQ